jgi:hypothetical protein
VPDVEIELTRLQCQEPEAIPRDAAVIGHTWLKANKDGSPDKRFPNNTAGPIVEYGEIALSSRQGLREKYMISHFKAAEAFVQAWGTYRAVLQGAT